MKILKQFKNNFDCWMRLVYYTKADMKEKFGTQVKPYAVEFCPFKNPNNHYVDYKRWFGLGGSVGFKDSFFDSLEEAEEFIEEGLKREKEENIAEVWLNMLAVNTS